MASSSALRVVFAVGWLGVLLATACGGEDKSQSGEPVVELPSGDAAVADAGGKPSSSMDAGTRSALDAALTPPSHDGSLRADSATGDAAAVAVRGDASGPVVLAPLPNAGGPLAVCYRNADCKSDDLVCVGPLGVRGAGFCNDNCAEDADCPAVSGVPASCTFEGQCVLGCAGADGTGGGSCPANMVCRDITEGNLLTQAVYRCTYPLGAGKKNVAAGGQCALAHGAGDCADTLVCHLPAGGLVSTPDDGTGVCTAACEAPADCQVPAGSTAVALCSDGACELGCETSGATCPAGLVCRDVDDVPVLTQMRCRKP